MKKVGHIKTVFILSMITMILGQVPTFCQEVETKTVRILINNLPDTIPPSIKLMTPYITGDMIYETDTEEIDIIGEVRDESGVKFVWNKRRKD